MLRIWRFATDETANHASHDFERTVWRWQVTGSIQCNQTAAGSDTCSYYRSFAVH